MVDITEIYVHWYAGRSKSSLAASLGVDRKTVRKYLAPAEASGIAPGGPPMSEADWARLIEGWFPGLIDKRLRQVTWQEIDKHRDYIKELLGTVTVSTIHQRLRDEHKLKVSISSFRRWVHATLPDEVSRSQVTVLRDEIEPGEEAQIDYGFLGQWINPRTGKRHRVWAFVMVLPCSRHMFVRPVLHLDQHAWTEAHVAAFRYFDGYVGDHSSAISCFRPGWSLPSRSSDGLAAAVGATRRCRGEPSGIARARPGRRLPGVRGRPLPAKHSAGHRLPPEGLLLGGAQGAG
ncbi:hypothetical protein [Streptomyces sporangiiformans]|uniref:hypothetical protein n=1 Tax=Streptomyces sporangiiformans TaxID=2315329 RepID=UPI001F08C953|nr:hypothetical protein [Streptomyces sporangiiformans]